jgi:hypothetical protein
MPGTLHLEMGMEAEVAEIEEQMLSSRFYPLDNATRKIHLCVLGYTEL